LIQGFFAALVVPVFTATGAPPSFQPFYSHIHHFHLHLDVMMIHANNTTMLARRCVGIVIDDAVVVLKTSSASLRKGGADASCALRYADIRLAVIATTLSLVIIFLPVTFMKRIVRRFMSSFGFTSAFAIMVSLLVSFTLTPMLCARFLKRHAVNDRHEEKTAKSNRFYSWIDRNYTAMLVWSMRHRVGYVDHWARYCNRSCSSLLKGSPTG
jgi:HAE1 family hydrophobic/amphiphilic exporter-1